MPVDPEPFIGDGWRGVEIQGAAPQVICGVVDELPFQWRIRHGREEFRVAPEAGGNPIAVRAGAPPPGAFYAEQYWPSEPSRLDRTRTTEALGAAVESYRKWRREAGP